RPLARRPAHPEVVASPRAPQRARACNHDASVARRDRGLDHAPDAGWIVVAMKRDRERVFPGPADLQVLEE
ncbi:MAG: hypothetical protein V2I24_16255, partial [Halieaceae bacterium]|nr:hypothetical protein [Halieaceae bacterium]